ncbi:hypothetical protein ACLKA6_002187, partial [Drosophila palustris]
RVSLAPRHLVPVHSSNLPVQSSSGDSTAARTWESSYKRKKNSRRSRVAAGGHSL